jgi:hypothetical protein
MTGYQFIFTNNRWRLDIWLLHTMTFSYRPVTLLVGAIYMTTGTVVKGWGWSHKSPQNKDWSLQFWQWS